MRLYGHRYRLQVEDVVIQGLDIRFDVERTVKPTPNNATVTITNLSADHRKKLQELDAVFVRLEVGYIDGMWQIFQGDLRDVISHKTGTEWETVITSGDGERTLGRSRTVITVGSGATMESVLREIASQMGLTISDESIQGVQRLAQEGAKTKDFGEGIALAGSCTDMLEELLDGTGKEWSVQAGELQIIDAGTALGGQVVLIAEGHGMVGSPEPGNKGVTEVTSLLIPGLDPGRAVRVESEHVNGAYRIERVSDAGESGGGDWYAHMELKEIQ